MAAPAQAPKSLKALLVLQLCGLLTSQDAFPVVFQSVGLSHEDPPRIQQEPLQSFAKVPQESFRD